MEGTFTIDSIERGEYRENVSYAVGDPLGVFSYIPHVVFPDGSVWISKEAIQLLWESLHPNWYGTEKDLLWKDTMTHLNKP